MTSPGADQRLGRLRPGRLLFAIGLVVALLVAAWLSRYASSEPDGLSRVAQDTGLSAAEQESRTADSPLADYGVRGVADERLSGGPAGVAGVLLTLAVAGGTFRLVRRRTER